MQNSKQHRRPEEILSFWYLFFFIHTHVNDLEMCEVQIIFISLMLLLIRMLSGFFLIKKRSK